MRHRGETCNYELTAVIFGSEHIEHARDPSVYQLRIQRRCLVDLPVGHEQHYNDYDSWDFVRPEL